MPEKKSIIRGTFLEAFYYILVMIIFPPVGMLGFGTYQACQNHFTHSKQQAEETITKQKRNFLNMMHIFFLRSCYCLFIRESKPPFIQSTTHIRAIVWSYSRYTSVSGPPSGLTEQCRSLWEWIKVLGHFFFQPHTHYCLDAKQALKQPATALCVPRKLWRKTRFIIILGNVG